MNKSDLIIELIRYRFNINGIRQGFSKGEAALMAEQRIKNEGLFGFFAKLKLMATPEGSIVTIVESYFRSLIPQLDSKPELFRLDHGDYRFTSWNNECAANAIDQIETHRRRSLGGERLCPRHLKEYVYYRMRLEMMAVHHIEAEDMGFDQDTINYMVQQAVEYFKARIDSFRAR